MTSVTSLRVRGGKLDCTPGGINTDEFEIIRMWKFNSFLFSNSFITNRFYVVRGLSSKKYCMISTWLRFCLKFGLCTHNIRTPPLRRAIKIVYSLFLLHESIFILLHRRNESAKHMLEF